MNKEKSLFHYCIVIHKVKCCTDISCHLVKYCHRNVMESVKTLHSEDSKSLYCHANVMKAMRFFVKTVGNRPSNCFFLFIPSL